VLGLLLVLPAAYFVLWRRRTELLLCFLLPVFGVTNLPSEMKKQFILDIAGVNVYPQDLLLLIAIASMVFDPRMRHSGACDRTRLFLVSVYLLYHVLALCFFAGVEHFQLDYLRMTFIGALWMTLALYDFGPLAGRHTRYVSIAFTVHNAIVAAGAAALLVLPGVNDMQSPLASFVGFTADGSDEGSLVLVSALSGSLAVIGVWHFLFVDKKSLLSPHVVLAMLVVIATSHRIDYVALAVLYIVLVISGRWSAIPKRPIRTAAALIIYIGLALFALDRTGLRLQQDIAGPFLDRATSLFNEEQSGTVNERFEQYAYFFDGYLREHDLARYLFGEGYLPSELRDSYYQWVQPHNFLLYTVVNVGIVGLVLVFVIALYVVTVRAGWRSAAFLPLCLLLITQVTDAGFPQYPVSAYFAILLSLCCANRAASAALLDPRLFTLAFTSAGEPPSSVTVAGSSGALSMETRS